MVKKRLMTRGAVDASTGHATLHRGQSRPLAPMAARKPRSASLSASPPPVQVALLSKNHQSRTELGDGNDVFNLGEIYLNDLSDIRVFELTNTRPHALQVQLKAELRKPFHASVCNFQLENENLSLVEKERREPTEEYNHMPSTILRSSMRAALSAENVYLSEGYNELFNHIATINEVWLEPKQTKQVVFAVCTKLTSQQASSTAFAHANADSSEEERLHLNETSCLLVTGRIILKTQFRVRATSEGLLAPVPLPDITIPLQGQVCRSLLRLDVKELHFDDCIPGGSFVKDFTVWNRSEIPLLFQLVSSVSAFDETRHLLTFTDYNTGYVIGEKVLQAAAYGHVRIRVTYRPVEVGERFFEVHVQNLHDSRNVKILQIHAVTNKEHHREGLAIKEPNGSYMMSGSKLDFGDCYSGIATSKALVIRNATEASLHVELTSDRPKEVTFELKLQPNRSRSSRAPRTEDILSPTDSNEGSSRKESLSPDGAKAVANAFARFDSVTAYGADSDDDGDENEGEYEDDFVPGKRLSFEDNPLDPDDGDDDFEFDREPRPTPRSPPASPKLRTTGRDSRRRPPKFKPRRSVKIHSRVRDLTYESGVDSGNSICSSPERKPRGELRRRNSASLEDVNGSNFLVETIDLPPGMERTILVWYCPSAVGTDAFQGDTADAIESKASRLSKQTFRVSFRCFQIQGSWQQAQSRVYDRTLGKSIHIRARTCTSLVTVTPSILHMGDCNIGELKSSACVLTNHSELPTTVKPLVTSKVISTVPNDEITLGPKQSLELKVEIIPRKINPNYSRLISIMNLKNKSNIPQICVRSSNMDAHHVIYHSFFYKLLTPSRSAFLNFDQVTMNSTGMQVFDLENITNASLHLSLQSSDPTRVRLFCLRTHIGELPQKQPDDTREASKTGSSGLNPSLSTSSFGSQFSSSSRQLGLPAANVSSQATSRGSGRVIRRRRSIGCIEELAHTTGSTSKKSSGAILRGYLSKKISLHSSMLHHPTGSTSALGDTGRPRGDGGSVTPPLNETQLSDGASLRHRGSSSTGMAAFANSSMGTELSAELAAILDLCERSRLECEAFCHSSLHNVDTEQEVVGLVRERIRRLQALELDKKLSSLSGVKERNIRIPAKSKQRIIAFFSPSSEQSIAEAAKVRIEKHKILITLPPGGNKKAVADAARFDVTKPMWAISKHPFDSRPSVRELLVKGRVCRSIMNVNQKNINFGRITVSSKSSKKLVVQNMSAVPLVYNVEKTGSISSAFLEIKEGESGVVKGFGTKEICFEFQPTLAGPFEEKLKLVNLQDPENSISVTIKAKVVKRETFKLLQSGQVLSFGRCLVGEKSEEIKIAVRNTSRKRREYVIQLDPAFSNQLLRPVFYFSVDDAPSTIITQAQEKKLDEELEKLEHKLRIAVTKKKTDKITKLNSKISRVKALLSGEDISEGASSEADDGSSVSTLLTDLYDSNSESEFSESETAPRAQRTKRQGKGQLSDPKAGGTAFSQSANTLHFSLEAEATGRIVAYAVFQPLRSSAVADDATSAHESVPKSLKARKRQLRKDSAPLVGVGKLLLFEQQNKDVVKELQYNAEVFLRTPAGETAYYRAVGKAPLPPFPHQPLTRRTSLKKVDVDSESQVPTGGSRLLVNDIAPTRASLLEPEVFPRSARSSNQEGVITSPPASSHAHGRVVVKVEQNQLGMFRRSTLLVPIEESPVDSMGWVLNLSHTSAESIEVEVNWRPRDFARGLLTLVSEVNPPDLVAEGSPFARSDAGGQHGDAFVLPFKVQVPPSQQVELHVRWNYTSGSGFGASTSMASCVTSSTLEQVTKNAQMVAGKLEICEVMDGSPKSSAHSATSIEVALVKAIKRSLQAEPEVVDLGQQQQNAAVTGQFVLRNHSSHAIKFLLLSPITGEHTAAGGSVGDFSFESSTGHVDGMSEELVKFTYRGYTPGEHTQQLLVRNLSDRLDTTIVTVKARITRPVYVRIPELDPHATGKLEVLELGPCYVTPEMQDTSVDSPNVALKFSKTHRLTLVSQVDETLVLCASSNLKTQCYVFEDHRLSHEATNVTLAGMGTLDLYVAIRPRLSSDAFKTGSSRDLVGGIRIQLFRVVDKGSQEEDKSHMVAEFTVKFVGIAGASLARVTPMAIDFGVEHRPNGEGKVHDGQFELINVSKALPLDYRLFVSNDNDGYSDLDDGLEVFLNNEKGEVPPGEAAVVRFQVKARSHGLFRRRLLVENTHYVGKISTVEMILFVDNDAIQCKIESHAALSSSEDDQANRLALHDSLSLGMVPVIKLEDELSPLCAAEGNSEFESSHRRYRIYNKQLRGIGGGTPGHGVQRLFLTNVSDEDLIVRPISTLPFSFHWSDVATAVITNSWFHVQPTAMSAPVQQVRKLQISGEEGGGSFKTAAVYYGGVYRIPAHGSCGLCFDFAPIAGTPALPTDVMVSGRQFSVQGMIGIQSFASPGLDNSSARTVKMVDVFVSYGESWIQAVDRVISLGKIGCSLGWKSSPFEIAIKNQSEIPACIVIGDLPDCLVINGVRDGSPVTLPDNSAVSKNGSLTLSSLALKATGGSNESPSFRVLELAPLSTCFVDLEFIQGSKTLSAGTSDFDVKLYNLYNPHNIEQVTVSAQIVSSYADVIIDPESSISATEPELDSENVALLPPVMIPPIAEGAPLGPNFWFSIKNVFDEELSIKLLAQSDERFKSSWELLLFSRSSNTPVSNLSVAPGDSIDVRVICRVFPSARISSDLIVHGVPGGLISFGSVTLDITVQNIPDATQRKEISVRGKIVPGRTFTLSSSSLHFYAASAELAPELSAEFLPPSLKAKARDSSQPSAVASETAKSTVYQLRTSSENFWIRNPSTVQPLNFAIDQVAMYNATLCLIKGATAKDACAMTEYIQAVATPSSGTIQPGEAMKITVRLEEASLLASADGGHFADSGDNTKALASLHKMRHHPSWRSNSWGTDMQDSSNDVNVQNHMYLTVRDVDMSVEAALTSEVDIHLMLQSSSSSIQGNDASKGVVIDRTLLSAAFAAREKRLSTPKKGFLPPLLGSVAETAHREQSDSMVLDNFEEFDVGTIRFSSVGKKNQLPVLSVRGCTPAENSSLDSTRYVIDVGQHTVRNGGEVEWEITIESVYGSAQPSEPGSLDPVEYRLYLVDQSAKSWVQLSRDRGTLDRSRSYQSIVLYFWRDAIGVYSTFVVLQNLTNPGDLKVIHVKLEVVADLNVLRSMVSGVDPSTNLFRVLVSTHGVIRKLRRITSADIAGTIEHEINSSPPRGDPKLVVDYGEVYYHKLYHNHSIVLENSSSMALDFMLSSNALPNEVSFSVSPTSFSEVTTVNLAARGRVQVFLHFRPQPRRVASSDAPARAPENWYREIEVYVNCRLVKDFRETVVLRAICHPPQLAVNVSSSSVESILPRTEAVAIEGFDQPNFLGLVFNMSESALMNAEGTSMGSTVPAAKFLVVHNTRSDIRSRIAIRNDSMFFAICIDADFPTQREVEVDTLENGVGAGRRSTLLVTIPPESSVVFRIVPDLEALRKHRQLWDQSVKEHITLYNIKQFAEHYQVVLTFTCSNSLASFYIPSSLTESYPFSALEDMIAKFLQNYNSTWKWLLTYHETHMDEAQPIKSSPSGSFSIPRLAEVLGELEYALDQASPLSPRRPGRSASIGFEDDSDSREALRQLLHSYRALYFDFFYITDELVWYGVRSNAVRRSLVLAELAYGVVFNHEVFRVFLGQELTVDNVPIFPRLLLPWIRQLRHFLSFFPENQEATLPLRQLYDQLHKFELA